MTDEQSKYTPAQQADVDRMRARYQQLYKIHHADTAVTVTGPFYVVGEWTGEVYAEGRTFPEAFQHAQKTHPSLERRPTPVSGRLRSANVHIYPEPVRVMTKKEMIMKWPSKAFTL